MGTVLGAGAGRLGHGAEVAASGPVAATGVAPVARGDIVRWVGDLDDKDFGKRDAAEEKLKGLPGEMLPAVKEALAARVGSEEVAERAGVIVPVLEAKVWEADLRKKGEAAHVPVYVGVNVDGMPQDETVVTQVISVKSVAVAVEQLAPDLRALLGPGGSVSLAPAVMRAIVVTDTASRVRRIAQVVRTLDQPPQAPAGTAIDFRQMQFINAADAARLLNAVFAPPPRNLANVGRGGVPGRGLGALGPGGVRLYADSDARTNTVILSGTDGQIAQARRILDELDNPQVAQPPAPVK